MNTLPDFFDNFYNENYVYEYLYPYPLADLYRRFRVSLEPFDQLGYLLSAGEASLKLFASVATSLGSPSIVTENLKRLKLSSPSFGTWQQIITTMVPASNPGSLPLEKALFECVRGSSERQSQYLTSIQKLIEFRNKYAHGGTMTNATAKVILDEALPSFRQAFREINFLAQCPFVICEEVKRIRTPACFEAVMRICQGCNPIFSYELWRLKEPIDPQVAYLLSPDLTFAYSLHPIVAVFLDERLSLPRCYFYAHRRNKTVWQTYEFHQDNFREGSLELENEIQDFFNGDLKVSQFQLNFLSDSQPKWSVAFPKGDNKTDLPVGYKMLGKIGEGRYGVVYKVLHTGLQEVRAFKVLKHEVAQDPRIRKRFEIEAQALSRLRGKNVAIDLYEYGETVGGLPYLIMQLAEGGSIKETMERWGKKSYEDVVKIALSCFKGLDVIHKNGILHRDIKLSNILLSADSYLFCDFGVGKLLDIEQQLTVDGDMIGTINYMAPEQLEGLADVRTDIYSLGICLVHLLAGKQISDCRSWLYREFQGDIEFRNTLLGLIEPISENRPPNASAVVERLERINKNLPQFQVNTIEISKVRIETNYPIEAISEKALEPTPSEDIQYAHKIWRSPEGSVYRLIPAGEFLMGGTIYHDERPVHKVIFSKPFLMSTTLVTNAQYIEFCKVTGYRGSHDNFLLHLKRDFFPKPWKHGHAPVVFISWKDAKEYILWLCEQDGHDYQLPTEAQWEYACRAGTRTVYPWGNKFNENLLNASKGRECPTVVGSYPPNQWGLFDMLGNVWEWCEDVKDVAPAEESLFYRACAENHSTGVVEPVNTYPNSLVSKRVDKDLRVVRGGSWFSDPRNARPANRRGQASEGCVRSVGFRLVVLDVANNELESTGNEQ